MSEFSTRLEEYIRLSGYTLYSFAKHTGIDRTTINKITTERRLPSLDYMKNICSYLKVSDTRKDELIELYKKEKYGESTVRAWKEMGEFLNTFILREEKPTQKTYMTQIPERIFFETVNDTDSREILIEIILEEIQKEKSPELFMDVSWASSMLLQFICQKNLSEKIDTHVFMTINQKEVRGGALHNFRNLRQILSNIFIMDNHLDSRYAYVNDSSDSDKYQPFRHYLITHKHVALFNDDWKIGVISEGDIASSFMEREKSRLKDFRPFVLGRMNIEQLKSEKIHRLFLGRSVCVIEEKDRIIFTLNKSKKEIQCVATDIPELCSEFKQYFDLMENKNNLYEGEEEIKKALVDLT